jgi:hypothetical protein
MSHLTSKGTFASWARFKARRTSASLCTGPAVSIGKCNPSGQQADKAMADCSHHQPHPHLHPDTCVGALLSSSPGTLGALLRLESPVEPPVPAAASALGAVIRALGDQSLGPAC